MAIKLDLKGLHSLKKRLIALEKRDVKVGFFDDVYDDGMSVAHVAMLNNYGTHDIPERPFMEDTFLNKLNKARIKAALKDVFKSVAKANGASLNALNKLGDTLTEIMKTTIDDYPGHNSKSTIARKGFDDPLYDTGKMLASVKFVIDSSKQLTS
jgi:hypothetical protein